LSKKRTATTEPVTLSDPAADPRLVQLSHLVTLAADGKPPTEFCLLNAGETRTTKGSILCDDAHAALCLGGETMPADGLLPLDYDHDMVSFMGSNKKAAGWFKLSNRQGSLWATDVQFTPAATKALADREYRYFSPALFRDEEGYVTRIINCALTCLPATLKQKPLVTSEVTNGDPKDMTLEQLLAAFNVANATQLAAAFNTAREEVARLRASELTLTATCATLQGEVNSGKAALATLAAHAEQAEKATLIASLLSAGKLAPALKTWAEGQPIATLNAFSAAAPVVAPVAVAAPATSTRTATGTVAGDVTLSAEEETVIKQMGLSREAYLAERTTRMAQTNPYAVGVEDIEAARGVKVVK
jgi:phage I-like protein